MKTILTVLVGLLICIATPLFSQNETEIKVDGLLIPRVDRNTVSSPSLGQLIFDTTTDRFWFYDGSQWLEVDNVDDLDSDPTNEIELPSGGNNGDVLSTDGMSNYNWISPNSLSIDQLSDSDGDTKVQVEESLDDDQIRFDIMGNESVIFKENPYSILMIDIAMSSYNRNLHIGQNAGENNANGYDNMFIGQYAGQNNIGGDRNIFIGNDSGLSNSSGQLNCFVGFETGVFGTSSSQNTFIGSQAGKNNTGNNNSFIGHKAGFSNTTGNNNTFVGRYSGYTNQNGYNNTFVGLQSGIDNFSGINNCFIGRDAGRSNTIGDYNTCIGSFSGNEILSGDKNVCIGYYAGPTSVNNNVSNKLYIDIEESDTPLIYGEFDNDLVKINGQIHISETLKLEPLSTAPTCDASNEGMMYYNSTSQTLNICKGASGWKEIQTN